MKSRSSLLTQEVVVRNWFSNKVAKLATLDGWTLEVFNGIAAALLGLMAVDAGCHQLSPPDYTAFAPTLVIIGLKKLWRIHDLPCSRYTSSLCLWPGIWIQSASCGLELHSVQVDFICVLVRHVICWTFPPLFLLHLRLSAGLEDGAQHSKKFLHDSAMNPFLSRKCQGVSVFFPRGRKFHRCFFIVDLLTAARLCEGHLSTVLLSGCPHTLSHVRTHTVPCVGWR